jgi:hypothetical protein
MSRGNGGVWGEVAFSGLARAEADSPPRRRMTTKKTETC